MGKASMRKEKIKKFEQIGRELKRLREEQKTKVVPLPDGPGCLLVQGTGKQGQGWRKEPRY
jgi:hypothetical protein